MLAIDSGNTAIKWGLHDGSHWYAQDSVLQHECMSLAKVWVDLPPPVSIMISNVAGRQVADDLTVLLAPWKIKPTWITARASQCGVSNGYANPEQLGSDRWAALLAAWHRKQQACLVVDTGTAMTVDALDNQGRFLGGIIVPGPESLLQVLSEYTNVQIADSGRFQCFPDNTDSALASGVVHALVGALERMHHLLIKQTDTETVPLILSGRGATWLLPHLHHISYEKIDDLVLEGLLVIANASTLHGY